MPDHFQFPNEWDGADLEYMELPTRSRLYSLEPRAVGTHNQEGLVSYIIRLARAHMVSPRRLIKAVFAEENGEIRKLSYNSFFVEYIGTANGLGSYARLFSDVANRLTGRTDLQHLTMLPWERVLPENGEGLIFPHRQWCSPCLAEQLLTRGECYSPLLWSLKLYRVCAKHKIPLTNRCPKCGRAQSFLPAYPDISHCGRCGCALASVTVQSSAGVELETNGYSDLWVERSLESAIARHDTVAQCARSEHFVAAVRALLDSQAGGNRAQFCRALGWNIWALNGWLNKGERPTLPKILELATRFRLDLVGLCTDPGAVMKVSSHHASQGGLVQRSKRPALTLVDKSKLEGALNKVIESTPDGPPLNDVAKALGLRRTAVKYWFPHLAKLICKRNQEAKRDLGITRRTHRRQLVLHCVQSLENDGAFPSRRRVDGLLKEQGLALARPELGNFYLYLMGRDKAMMSDSEFNELIQRLHKFSATDGDIGHEYWTRVIRQLKEMRAMAFALESVRNSGSS